jgi:hypothetical protein
VKRRKVVVGKERELAFERYVVKKGILVLITFPL